MAQVTVTINNREYGIACEDGQEVRIIQLARILDEKAKLLTANSQQINENIVVTAAVLNNVNVVKKQYLQDYEKWLSIGIVDEIEIMCYTFSLNYLNNWINDASDLMNEYSVRIGISSRLEGNSLIADFSQMMLASKKEGFIIFSSNLYTNDYIYKIMKLSNINY